MEKKFKVVANSAIMDVEVNVRHESEAHEMFEKFRDSGMYHRVYIVDNETGEVYRTYDISVQSGGVRVNEWFKLAGDL